MLSPRFLRTQAEKCFRSALAATDLDVAADLKRMGRNLESWAKEAIRTGDARRKSSASLTSITSWLKLLELFCSSRGLFLGTVASAIRPPPMP